MKSIKKIHLNETSLRKFNNALTVVVIVFGLYLIILPFLPRATYVIQEATGQINQPISYGTEEEDTPIPADNNRLVIPRMGLDDEVHESEFASALQQGIWRRPQTSTPDQGGNTVMVAHRFAYRAPAVFYHLDKLEINDEFAVMWEGKRYDYKVREIKVVEPTAIEVEDNTEESILTLYTCTPMWTAEKRLVVISDLIEES